MVTKKKFQKEHLSIILMTVLLIVSVIINLTSAYFTDSASVTSSSSLTFGTIAVRALPNGETYRNDNTYPISADEVAMKEPLYKLIKIENQPNVQTQDFYMRVKLSFYNNDVIDNSNPALVTFTLAPSAEVVSANYGAENYSAASTYNASNWLAGNNDGKLYYKYSVSLPANSAIYIPVKITFGSTFGYENFNNPYVKFEIEIIQSANNGYTGWNSDKPTANWPQTQS